MVYSQNFLQKVIIIVYYMNIWGGKETKVLMNNLWLC